MELDVRIELVQGSESIQGAVVAAGGTRIEFSGWLGLAAVLGGLLDPPAELSDPGAEPPQAPPAARTRI